MHGMGESRGAGHNTDLQRCEILYLESVVFCYKEVGKTVLQYTWFVTVNIAERMLVSKFSQKYNNVGANWGPYQKPTKIVVLTKLR